MKIYTVMLAGGAGTRMKSSLNKTLLPLSGKTVIRRSIEAFSGLTDEMIVVCHPDIRQELTHEATESSVSFPIHFVDGGDTRQKSVLNGLLFFDFNEDDMVMIHDAARCLITADIIENVIQSVKNFGTGVPGIPVSSTYKICDKTGFVSYTPDRNSLFEIQTPQGFKARELLDASLKASQSGFESTDDAGLMEHFGNPVHMVCGSRRNMKLTTQDDLFIANYILKGDFCSMRIGMGFDVHQLAEGRKLYLCGIEIPWKFGLLGHSDADVALHALMDAMLGACGMGDIGRHFPDTDERYKGISSLLLLEETNHMVNAAGYRVFNVDITIVAQKPKLIPYISQMVQKIAEVLKTEENAVNIKATTTEKLGFEGREEGISAYAVCTIEKTYS